MVKNLMVSTALCGFLLGGVARAESEDTQVEESKEVYKKKDDGTQESTSKKETEVRSDDDSGEAVEHRNQN